MFSDIQLREVFHFCFLHRLLKISDINLYILKGGVNLRFYFGSPRYSEDMDMDVVAGNVGTLRKNGYKILEDAAFIRSLRVFGIDSIEVNDPGKAKHTRTTQRFGCSLVRTSGVRLPTKVEFSRRADDPGDAAATELLDSAIAHPYRKLAFPCRHYTGSAAALQKIHALAGRTVTQARDVFDLGILIRGGHLAAAVTDGMLHGAPVQQAIDSLLGLHWEDYDGQVVEYLDNDSREEFGDRDGWVTLQNLVFETLQDHV
jgi:predicted nucleotidyltransferase component of viral defense system